MFEVDSYVSKPDAQRLVLMDLFTQIIILDGRMAPLDQRVLLAFYVGDCQDHTVSGLSRMVRCPDRSVRLAVTRMVKMGLLRKEGVRVIGIPILFLRAHLRALLNPPKPNPVI